MLLGLEMADGVDQSFVKVHFHKMTTEYSNWLVSKIVDKEAKMVAMREFFLRILKFLVFNASKIYFIYYTIPL